MNLSKELKDKLYEYFIKVAHMYDYRKGWLKGDCPACGEHKFGVNLGLNRSNCFVCQYKDAPLDIVRKLENVDTYYQVKEILSKLDGITYKEEQLEALQLNKDNVLPEGYHNIKRGKSVLARSARRYLSKRGFDINELSRAGFGYCDKGKYFGYIIMPFYYQGLLVYFNARLFLGSGPKFNNPLIEDFGLGKSFLIYNRDALTIYDRIYLVESVTNARTIGDNAIAIGGKVLSGSQLNEIIKSPCTKVIIGLDRDAILYSIDIAFKLIEFKKVKIIEMPDSRDINDRGRKTSLILATRAKYLDYKGLQRLKIKYENETRT